MQQLVGSKRASCRCADGSVGTAMYFHMNKFLHSQLDHHNRSFNPACASQSNQQFLLCTSDVSPESDSHARFSGCAVHFKPAFTLLPTQPHCIPTLM